MKIFEVQKRDIVEIELNDSNIDFDAFVSCAREARLRVYETECDMSYVTFRAAVIRCSRTKKIVCVVDTDSVDENILLFVKFLISLFTPVNT